MLVCTQKSLECALILFEMNSAVPSLAEVEREFTAYDLRRLELYARNLVDHHLVTDLLPALARMHFLKALGDVHLSAVQSVSF